MSRQAVIYTRVSTEEQARSGLGGEAQEAACSAWCSRNGYSVVGRFSDMGSSGGKDPEKREGMARLLAYLAADPEAVVVVYSLSRLSRRQSHIWRLLDDRGAYRLRVSSATEPFETNTPMGRAMLGMLAVWAQLEADMCAERTKAALAARRARGLRLGATPMIILEPELITSIAKLRYEEHLSCNSIAFELNKQGVPGVRGGRWHENTVRSALDQWKKARSAQSKQQRTERNGRGEKPEHYEGGGAQVESARAPSSECPVEEAPQEIQQRPQASPDPGVDSPTSDGGPVFEIPVDVDLDLLDFS